MNRFYLIVEQMACRWLEGIAGYVENERQDAHKKMKDDRKLSIQFE